jgi:ribosome maturation factor RimP
MVTTAHKTWQSVLGRNVGTSLKAFLSGDKKAGRKIATFHSQTVTMHLNDKHFRLIISILIRQIHYKTDKKRQD